MLSEKPRSGLSETRKMTKSTMEKKRRARINNSLTELKSILSGMISNKGERFDKMEKADILEMTVKCVRQLQKQANTGDARLSNLPCDEDYRSGMHTCMSEVIKFISSSSFSDTDPEVKTKLLDHLANKLHSGSNKRQMDPETEISSTCRTYTHESNAGVTHIDNGLSQASEMKNDSNNNLQTLSDKNTSLFTQVNVQKSPNETKSLPIHSPVFTSYKSIQTIQDNMQQPPSMPTVPLTILVPANICSAAVGTTCVIPLNLQTASPQLGQNTILATVTQSSQPSFTVNPGSRIPVISTSNSLPNAQESPKPPEIMTFSPDSRTHTVTPTELSKSSRPPDNTIYRANETVKQGSVPLPIVYHTLSDNRGPDSSRTNNIPDSLPVSVLNQQEVSLLNETRSQQMSEFPILIQNLALVNENYAKHLTQNSTFNDSRVKTISHTAEDFTSQSRKTIAQEHSTGQDRISFNEQRQFKGNRASSQPGSVGFHYNVKPGSVCDNATSSMWRPW